MAVITRNERERQNLDTDLPGADSKTPSRRIMPDIPRPGLRWLAGLGTVLLVLIICLVAWGPDMEYPTTVSTSQIEGTNVEVAKSVRDVTGSNIDEAVRWLQREGAWLFGGLNEAVVFVLIKIEQGLGWIPWPVLVVGIGILSFAVGRWPLMLFTVAALLFMGFMDLWENAIKTVALMAVAVAVSVAIGFPLGVLGARSRMADNLMRPILDGMQTMPSFVYLLPAVAFFGLGKSAGIFATVIYAVPPVIRLTNLGIRQVNPSTVEAARSFGASPLQILTKVQMPMALPTIMAGINQTTMMALAMVTIASLVAAGGLGDNVLRALQKNEYGNGIIAGLAIVFLAIIFDRLTQAAARSRQEALSEGH